jgi:ABC-2 type transport system ATP-binding protein
VNCVVNAVEIENVSMVFRPGMRRIRVPALSGITLRIREGAIAGLVGPNGAGKSTLLKIIVGLLAPTTGACRVFGVSSDRIEARVGVGFLPETPDYYPHLTGFEQVRFHARLGGVAKADLAERVGDALARVGLRDARHRRVGSYSNGMRQRLGWAQVLVLEPRLVVLDEPTSAIDPLGTAEIHGLVRELQARGCTVLLSSHLLGQVEDLCDWIALLDGGRVVLQGSVDELTRRGDQEALLVDALPDAIRAELHGWLEARGVAFHGGTVLRKRLDELFLETVGADRKDERGNP